MSGLVHIVNISGGKDSAATYLLAIERGRPFRAVTADTGHEHPITYEWISRLAERTGGPEIEVVRGDFAREFAVRRANLPKVWGRSGIPQAQIDRALELLHPTGNPFLDVCMLKGRFPSTKVRFCTEELKIKPIERHIIVPALERGPIIQWKGERHDESERRANLPRFQRVRWIEPARTMMLYRPILKWTADDVFALHDKHGLEPNPLYKLGFSRVGCAPCIMCAKSEIRELASRFPEEIERVREWERLVAAVSKRGLGTFFAADKTPDGARMAEQMKREGSTPQDFDWLGIDEVAEWSKTDRGGRQYRLFDALDDPNACSSTYGLCE